MSARAIPLSSATEFNPAINGFRGLCVLLVFGYHVANSGLAGSLDSYDGVAGWLAFLASACRYGVELFFMISGYVIVGSLRRHGDVSAFLRDRCARIFPVWIPLCVLMFIGGVLAGWKSLGHADMLDRMAILFGNLLLLPPLVPVPMLHPATWSLTYEWLFYLLAAAAFSLTRLALPRWRQRLAWSGWTLVTLALIYLMPRGLWFIPGVLVALGVVEIRGNASSRAPFISMLLFLLAWRLIDMDHAEPGAHTLVEFFSGLHLLYVAIAMFAALHFFSSLAANVPGVSLLCGATMQRIGTLSYSFYLWHPVVMFMVKPVIHRLLPTLGSTLSVLLFAALSMVMSLLLSWVSWHWLEQTLGRALRRRRRTLVLPVAEGLPATLRARGM